MWQFLIEKKSATNNLTFFNHVIFANISNFIANITSSILPLPCQNHIID